MIRVAGLAAALLAFAPAAARADAIDEAFAAYAKPASPGCALGLARKGQPTAYRAWGQADLEHQAPVTPDTVFEAGSVSKQFTAAAILLLAQDGKLSLNDDVRRYLPELPALSHKVTIDQMLTHTAGLRDWGELAGMGGWPRGTRALSNLDALEIVARQKALNFTPGSDWSYTNSGYTLAAIVVARVSGQSFADFTRDRLFKPLGMAHTGWRDDFRKVVPGRAIAYAPAGFGAWRQDMPFEDVHGHGGLLTTVGDLLIWNEALAAGRLGLALSAGLQRQAVLGDGRKVEYGRGLFVTRWRTALEVSHSGATAGYRAWLGRYPEQGLSIALLCNAANVDATFQARKIADLYLPAVSPAQTPVGKPPATAPAELASRPGAYVPRGGGDVLRLVAENGALKIEGGAVLEPAADGGYRTPAGRFVFLPNGDLQKRTPENLVTVYEHARPIDAAPSALAGLAGTYVSDEADARLTVRVQAGKLTAAYADRPSWVLTLTPLFRDGYGAAGEVIRVLRGSDGKVTGLKFSSGRVWDLRFRKVS